ncbi:MAG: hypothetical protein QXT43_01045 [Candidatus Micrarchaeaceae archaeon]
MEVSITSDKPNRLLKRREITCTVNYAERTPSRQELKAELVRKLALKPELTVIVSISQEYGLRSCLAVAHAYDSAEAMSLAQRHLIERDSGIKKEKKPEAKATAQAEQQQENK